MGQPPLTRRAALAIWWALVLLPLAFVAVILGLEGAPQSPELRPLFFWLAIGASVLDVVLSRVLAPRIGAASSDPEALAFTRLLLAWALCEAAALFPLVAYLITGDPRLLGIFAVDLLALVLLFPSAARIESLMPSPLSGAPPTGRMVR